MGGLLRKIRRTGRVAEAAPPRPEPGPLPAARELGGSAQVRCIDAGSCNGCEIEIGNAFGPVYDAERYGARLVASPRHADVALVTGPVTRNMAEPLRRTVAAMPQPALVVAVGDCALDCGEFAGGYGVEGAVADVVPVDVRVPGCPPEPAAIVAALRTVTGR
ncbi:NADH-quinone oxidoreductase subunit B family protein [Actinacidiphila bryophytorum]|jgi:Ni,Fe-hydrogenase III small subunit|uniref:Formate hydrogenlyase subunit 7 n=1 Tax=Actinacidiphila bryophytorum TaxID=1436133 RepID=A0A9W4E2Z4_9ACTN|nr:oxidoreductase [Actinacidiphila bryophytorum]MBM9437914.1 oxidoreductase [Actinacidiphila bryophytorum]MBN6547721.1 oxidoreductase [Actinacidiphila bryophytorum]UWE11083.1 oxidoreductase [Actinacidiphila bryophytorum]CAG7623272.1 Formate hydrogenlyase subunit 7 [Actinacidiphila bryophytorum]